MCDGKEKHVNLQEKKERKKVPLKLKGLGEIF